MPQSEPMTGLRWALRSFQSGLYVLTCGQGPAAHAATISWVTQVSLKPRRVAIGVRKNSHIYPVLQQNGEFGLSVVGEGQEQLASTFFKYVPAGDDEIGGHACEAGHATGVPLLLEAPAWLECRVVEEANAGGDHGLFVADVLAGGVRQEGIRPVNLANTPWSYGG